jgi:uncharacterized protein (TIGR02646 family)
MHKLDRTGVLAPTCLAGYQYPAQNWDAVVAEHKGEIREKLIELQGERCAYCEGPPYFDGHIEHFRRKNPGHYPHLTFDWTNLFLACGSLEHCGHYKDRRGAPPYNPDRLIKPDIHDPDELLYFYSSGEVRVRAHLPPEKDDQANETIRVFNLNDGKLMAARKRALRIYREREPNILEALLDFCEADRKVFIDEEIQATCSDPYWTTIRHFFEKVH